MNIRVWASGNIEVVDEWDDAQNELDLNRYDDYSVYEISDEGCQAVNCEISRPKQGHNGVCRCFSYIPLKSRIEIRKFLQENRYDIR